MTFEQPVMQPSLFCQSRPIVVGGTGESRTRIGRPCGGPFAAVRGLLSVGQSLPLQRLHSTAYRPPHLKMRKPRRLGNWRCFVASLSVRIEGGDLGVRHIIWFCTLIPLTATTASTITGGWS